MLRSFFKKASLNLGAFLSVLSAIAIMESSFWALAGTIALLIGLATAAVSLYHYYLGRKMPFDINWVYIVNMVLLLLLSVYHTFNSGIMLGLIFFVSDFFVFLCYQQLNGKISILPK